MSENAERILYGSSLALPEVDNNSEEAEFNADNATTEYDIINLVECIGTPEFKFIFPNLINNIRTLSVKTQQMLSQKILDKIEEVYEFRFYYNIPLDNKSDCNDVYNVISYIEYKGIDFISFVWNFLGVNILDINIEMYCKNNSDMIINEIEEQIDIRDIPKLFSIFLRTYNKEQLIKWFYDMSVESRIELILNQETGEDQNE